MSGLYESNPDGVLPNQYLQAYAILEVQQQSIDKKIVRCLTLRRISCLKLSLVGHRARQGCQM